MEVQNGVGAKVGVRRNAVEALRLGLLNGLRGGDAQGLSGPSEPCGASEELDVLRIADLIHPAARAALDQMLVDRLSKGISVAGFRRSTMAYQGLSDELGELCEEVRGAVQVSFEHEQHQLPGAFEGFEAEGVSPF